jgi:hypothetical protein
LAFQSAYVHGAMTEHDSDGLHHTVKLRTNHDPPLHFGVWLGEALYQWRSLLDHMVTAMVAAAGGTPTRSHQFPIYIDRGKYEIAARTRLAGIPRDARKIIDSV